MKAYFIILLSSLLFIGCAANEVNYDFDAQLKAARKSMQVIHHKKPDWCSAEQDCQYLGSVNCGVNKGSIKGGKKACMKRLKKKAAQLGGDLLLVQNRGMVAGQDEILDKRIHYRAYAHVYKCSDKNTEFSKKYIAEYGKPNFSMIKFVSKEYLEACKKPVQCKNKKKQNCSSIQDEPFDRCIAKLARQSRNTYNTVVINNELFNKIGSYRMFAQSYVCK